MEEKRRIYLSLENFSFLTGGLDYLLATIKGIEKRIIGTDEVEFLIFDLDKNIEIEKRINRRDDDTITLLIARYGTIVGKKVKIKKSEFKGRPILVTVPLTIEEERIFGGNKNV